jgi:hypothetical protein
MPISPSGMARLLSEGEIGVVFDHGLAQGAVVENLSLEDVDRAVVEMSAIGETLLCALLGECRTSHAHPGISH